MSKKIIAENLPWLYVAGIDIPKEKMYLRAIFLTTTSLIIFAMEILQIFFNIDNIDIVAGVIEVCGPVYLALTKIIMLTVHRKTVNNILKSINAFWSAQMFNSHIEKKIETMFVTVKTLLSMYRWLAVITTTMIITLKPIFTGSGILPVDIWQPFNMLAAPQYYVIYILQCLSGYFCCLINIAFDSLYVAFITHLIAQLMLLKYAFENIPIKFIKNDVDEKICLGEIKKCVQYHIHILEVKKTIQASYSLVFFNIFATGIINVCIDLYSAASSGTLDFSRIITYAFQCSFFAFLLFVYCYPGNVLTHQSLSVSDAIYNSEWYLYPSPAIQKCVVLIILRSQKPEQLAAGEFILLDLDNFIKMLRLAFSVFTLIRKQAEKNNETEYANS